MPGIKNRDRRLSLLPCGLFQKVYNGRYNAQCTLLRGTLPAASLGNAFDPYRRAALTFAAPRRGQGSSHGYLGWLTMAPLWPKVWKTNILSSAGYSFSAEKTWEERRGWIIAGRNEDIR